MKLLKALLVTVLLGILLTIWLAVAKTLFYTDYAATAPIYLTILVGCTPILTTIFFYYLTKIIYEK